jgi:hypothetical protein
LPDTTGGHLRVVRSHVYRVVPRWSPKEHEKQPLPGVWADVGAAAADGEDQTLIAEDLDGAKDSIPAYAVLLLELFHRWQWAVPPFALGDLCSEDGG